MAGSRPYRRRMTNQAPPKQPPPTAGRHRDDRRGPGRIGRSRRPAARRRARSCSRRSTSPSTPSRSVRPDQLGAPTPCTEYDVDGPDPPSRRRGRPGRRRRRGDEPGTPPGRLPRRPPRPTWSTRWPRRPRRSAGAWADDATLDRVVELPWATLPAPCCWRSIWPRSARTRGTGGGHRASGRRSTGRPSRSPWRPCRWACPPRARAVAVRRGPAGGRRRPGDRATRRLDRPPAHLDRRLTPICSFRAHAAPARHPSRRCGCESLAQGRPAPATRTDTSDSDRQVGLGPQWTGAATARAEAWAWCRTSIVRVGVSSRYRRYGRRPPTGTVPSRPAL